MKKRIRLVGGPFGGKVIDAGSLYGRNEIVYRGPQRMTRKDRYDHMRDNYRFGVGPDYYRHIMPQTEARYRLAMRVHSNGTQMITAPCQHPDGSLFYEYEEGSKREL